jgi:hypothetical protein
MPETSAWIVRGTIWIALVAFVAAEHGRASARRTGRAVWWSFPVFVLGAAFCAAHFAAALHWRYGWSHARALEATARQTAEVYGTAWSGGLWVNYAFIVAWICEAGWWMRHPDYPTRRPTAATWTLRAFYVLVIVNAAVIFPAGATSLVGLALVGALLYRWIDRQRRFDPLGSMRREPGRASSSPPMRRL